MTYVTSGGASVDSAWEQKKLEARKISENATDSHPPVRALLGCVFYVGVCIIPNPAKSPIVDIRIANTKATTNTHPNHFLSG
jgi:hypothetical protein